jgi:putative IMPACT (imprinted ancient) family translation regulator
MQAISPLLEPLAKGQSELRELGSRFFAFAFPVKDKRDVEFCLGGLQKQFPDATHICYAYRLGLLGEDSRAADAGEPKYSAGVPILNAIKAKHATHVLVAVVRYYGGTNLGIGGLVKAYSGAATLALEKLPFQDALDNFAFQIEINPSLAGIIYNWAKKEDFGVKEIAFNDLGQVLLEISGRGEAHQAQSTL